MKNTKSEPAQTAGNAPEPMTPIDVPLHERTREELLTILGHYREDLQWYVEERNRLIAQIEDANRLDQSPRVPDLREALEGMLELETHTHRLPNSINQNWCDGIVDDAKAALSKARVAASSQEAASPQEIQSGQIQQWNGKLQPNGTVYEDTVLIEIQRGEIRKQQCELEYVRKQIGPEKWAEIFSDQRKIYAGLSDAEPAPSPATKETPRLTDSELAAMMCHWQRMQDDPYYPSEPALRLLLLEVIARRKSDASSQGPAREETPLLAKQLSREYNFTSQGDRDQALRMGAELFGGGFSDGFIAGAKSVVAAPQNEIVKEK